MEACIRLVANWRRIPMNRSCAAAMGSFCQITLTTCFKKCNVAFLFLPFLFLCQRCSIDLICFATACSMASCSVRITAKIQPNQLWSIL